MFRLIGLVVSIGLADSLNPTTIAPALYLATAQHARTRLIEFTLGVFAVYLIGGLAIALGPGELLLSLIPHPGHHLSYILEIVAGVGMLTAAGFLWRYRHRLREREVLPDGRESRSSAVLGATITAVELPTAFPYFAAIAAVVGSQQPIVNQVVLIAIFNLCFIAPLLAMIGVLTFAGPNAYGLLARARQWLERRWPVVLAGLALLAGLLVTLLGVTGLASAHHNDFGTFSRRLRRLLHLHP
ncbi:MAG TPA: GAP family protein [Solirubrobacteraceae bacterium]|nr:GAP family protein [Solirubrobacteraceae bacterium]